MLDSRDIREELRWLRSVRRQPRETALGRYFERWRRIVEPEVQKSLAFLRSRGRPVTPSIDSLLRTMAQDLLRNIALKEESWNCRFNCSRDRRWREVLSQQSRGRRCSLESIVRNHANAWCQELVCVQLSSRLT